MSRSLRYSESNMQENDMRTFDIRKDSWDTIRKHENENITITGCLGERYIGCGMKDGTIHIEGTPGNALAAYLDGGTIYVDGNAQDATADTMNAGLVAIKGSAGDALAYGMRGGKVYVLGDAGYRAGVHMKAYEENKSILVIGGRTGSFLGEYLAGGIIVVLGLGDEDEDITGYFCGNGMYAGTIYLRTNRTPLNLSDKLVKREVTEEEKNRVLHPIISDFASVFSLSLEHCLSSSFIAIEADKSKTYSQLYAAV